MGLNSDLAITINCNEDRFSRCYTDEMEFTYEAPPKMKNGSD